MERLISLFHEADYERWSPSNPLPPPSQHQEPLYFQQLLHYLRQQKEQQAQAAESARQRLQGTR